MHIRLHNNEKLTGPELDIAGLGEYLIVELTVSNCLGMTNLGSAVSTKLLNV